VFCVECGGAGGGVARGDANNTNGQVLITRNL